jgi:hypothetical protein
MKEEWSKSYYKHYNVITRSQQATLQPRRIKAFGTSKLSRCLIAAFYYAPMSFTKKIHLREDEQIVNVVRAYWVTYAWKYIVAFLFLAAAAFFLFYFLAKGWWGYVALGLLVMVGLLIITRTWFFNYANALVITSARVVDISRDSMFDETISSLGFGDLKDVVVRRKGISSSLLNYGQIIIESKTREHGLDFRAIHQPHELQSKLLQLKEEHKIKSQISTIHGAYKAFLKAIPSLSSQQLENVVAQSNLQIEQNILAKQRLEK